MTQEEKNLLLKDLCARLFYGVKGLITVHKTMDENSTFNGVIDGKLYDRFANLQDSWYDNIPSIKPYLRPMSSLMKQEISIIRTLDSNCATIGILGYDKNSNPQWAFGGYRTYTLELLNYFNSIHIDYCGLIEKGLALEAPEGMYKS